MNLRLPLRQAPIPRLYIWSRGDYTKKQKVASTKQPSSSERECGLKYLEPGGQS
jgi:hypothetical protein